jgi:hypothetical protein
MRKTTDSFAFDIPEAWRVFPDGTRLVAHGPTGEELILSSTCVRAPETAAADEIARFLEKLFQTAKDVAQETASDPDLRITKRFDRDQDAGGWFPCWTLLSETAARDIFFAQAVLHGQRAVMLITFEAPNAKTRASEFANFLESFGPAEP